MKFGIDLDSDVIYAGRGGIRFSFTVVILIVVIAFGSLGYWRAWLLLVIPPLGLIFSWLLSKLDGK